MTENEEGMSTLIAEVRALKETLEAILQAIGSLENAIGYVESAVNRD